MIARKGNRIRRENNQVLIEMSEKNHVINYSTVCFRRMCEITKD